MRYTAGHKERTRARILARAAQLFRRRGYDGVGIDEIMAAAKLTRGGFYAHFRSKAELFAAVMALEHGFVRRLRARTGTAPQVLRDQALEIVTEYLAPENLERIGQGCHMASLSVDVARAGMGVRRGYRRNFLDLAAEFTRGMPGVDSCDPCILASIVLCIGAVTTARALDDHRLAAQILGTSRQLVAALLASPRT